MKKYYSTQEFKSKNQRRSAKAFEKLIQKNLGTQRRKRERIKEGMRISQGARKNEFKNKVGKPKKESTSNLVIDAPPDFRMIESPEKCLHFFRDIRNEDNIITTKNKRFVLMSLAEVTQIDYATISILTAVSDDLKSKNIIMRGSFPRNNEARKFIEDSGFLNHMVDGNNNPFPKTEKSDLIFFEKGQGVLSVKDNMRITEMLKNVINYLTGEPKLCLPVKTVLLEICGNSIEWADTSNKQWVLGVKYEEDKVVFTVTDVGKGILQTLNRKFGAQISDIFANRQPHEILRRAFEQKYGSSSQEVNRNKGLPSVKANFEQGNIRNLKVLTNNVILHFDNESLTRTFERGEARFKGTIYQWEMNKDCLNQLGKGST